MLDVQLKQYIDWTVKPVMRIKNGYGYRVMLRYEDGSVKVQQKAGFASKREAEKARELTIAELHMDKYIVYANVTVKEFMDFWLENGMPKCAGSMNTFDTFKANVENHIKPVLGNRKMKDIRREDIQKLYNMKTAESMAVAHMCKTVLNISFRYAVNMKVIRENPVYGVNLPKYVKAKPYHTRNIESKRTLSMEQVTLLLEKSKNTPIHIMVVLNVLMGLRRSEIIAVKYSDINYVDRTLTVHCQLGKKINSQKEDFAPKTYTKQEVRTKTPSSVRTIPIPDYAFEEIMKEREIYEKNRDRRRSKYQDLGYICCSSYGRPRSKDYHWKYYKKLLSDCGLPDIRWHDLRSTYCTMLLKNDFNPKAVSKLMGHAKEIITVDVYGDNKEIIEDVNTEIEGYMEEVLPAKEEVVKNSQELQKIVINTKEYLPLVGEIDGAYVYLSSVQKK